MPKSKYLDIILNDYLENNKSNHNIPTPLQLYAEIINNLEENISLDYDSEIKIKNLIHDFILNDFDIHLNILNIIDYIYKNELSKKSIISNIANLESLVLDENYIGKNLKINFYINDKNMILHGNNTYHIKEQIKLSNGVWETINNKKGWVLDIQNGLLLITKLKEITFVYLEM